MKRRERLPELLAPAGDFECLCAAVKGGADAIYIGGKSFGARAFAKNFEIEEIGRAVEYCHLYGVRLYVTMNTLLTDAEIGAALEFATELYKRGVDALIVCDLGLIRVLREVLPEMELHASTQMSVHNSLGADIAHSLGMTRVVLARELTGADIASVVEECKPEIEVFLHGALCVCHSGQCLFSSLVGGRSGNRGECAQPCRLPYSNGYPLSLTDLSLAGHIPSLIASGVASLKIEGRMKSPDYVYTVTSIYRRLLDENRAATQKEVDELYRAFSRGGFTDGYYTGKIQSRSMLGVRSDEDKRATRDKERLEKFDFTPTRVKISAVAEIKLGEPSRLRFTVLSGVHRGKTVLVEGEVAQAAISSSLDGDEVKGRLAKMGATLFSLDPTDIELSLSAGVNLSPRSINQLRRAATDALMLEISGAHPDFNIEGRAMPEKPARPAGEYLKSAYIYNPALLSGLESALDGFDHVFIPLFKLGDALGNGFGVALPPVVMQSELDEVRGMLKEAKNRGVTHALIGNLGHVPLISEAGLLPVADFRFNVTNSYTGATLSTLSVNNPLLSPELTAKDARILGGRAVVYGRIPLMITERCFMRDSFGCKSCSVCALTDRRGAEFPMLREYRHRTTILNSAVTYMGDKMGELRGSSGEHYIFTTETAEEIRAVLSAFASSRPMPLKYPLRRMGRREGGK